jgi:hypothetical protein
MIANSHHTVKTKRALRAHTEQNITGGIARLSTASKILWIMPRQNADDYFRAFVVCDDQVVVLAEQVLVAAPWCRATPRNARRGRELTNCTERRPNRHDLRPNGGLPEHDWCGGYDCRPDQHLSSGVASAPPRVSVSGSATDAARFGDAESTRVAGATVASVRAMWASTLLLGGRTGVLLRLGDRGGAQESHAHLGAEPSRRARRATAPALRPVCSVLPCHARAYSVTAHSRSSIPWSKNFFWQAAAMRPARDRASRLASSRRRSGTPDRRAGSVPRPFSREAHADERIRR